jgi:hypothetical protein
MRAIRFGVLAAVLLVSPALFATEASALLTGTCDSDNPGACSLSVGLTGSILTITLANTSNPTNGGYIVADAFNLGSATISGFASTDTDFFTTSGSTSVSPYGTRDTLVSITSSWLGGGSPTSGIGVGQSATFTLTLASLGGLTEQSIFDSTLIRFRGFADGDSDKDQVRVKVPEMSTLPLLVLGLTGVGVLWRRRR